MIGAPLLKVREGERLLNEGKEQTDPLARGLPSHVESLAQPYAQMKGEGVKRLKEIESAKLKEVLAEPEIDKARSWLREPSHS